MPKKYGHEGRRRKEEHRRLKYRSEQKLERFPELECEHRIRATVERSQWVREITTGSQMCTALHGFVAQAQACSADTQCVWCVEMCHAGASSDNTRTRKSGCALTVRLSSKRVQQCVQRCTLRRKRSHSRTLKQTRRRGRRGVQRGFHWTPGFVSNLSSEPSVAGRSATWLNTTDPRLASADMVWVCWGVTPRSSEIPTLRA